MTWSSMYGAYDYFYAVCTRHEKLVILDLGSLFPLFRLTTSHQININLKLETSKSYANKTKIQGSILALFPEIHYHLPPPTIFNKLVNLHRPDNAVFQPMRAAWRGEPHYR